MKLERELMRGAAPTAVLQVLSLGEHYGYELVEALERKSEGLLSVGQSTLYPLLYNLEAKKLVVSREAKADNGRVRRYYRLTAKGKKKLRQDKEQWAALQTALAALNVLPAPGSSPPGAPA